AISNCLAAATRPLIQVILTQGLPVPELGLAEYSGCVGATVHAWKEPPAILGQGLQVQQGVHSYLKFDLTPLKGKAICRARVTLVRPSGRVEAAQLLYCREVLSSWEPGRVRFSTRDGTAKWTDADYGEALVCPGCEPLLGRREWDATRQVQKALQ